jgi:hypothetical protein
MIFEENVIERKTCVQILSTILSDTVLILTIIQRDIITNVESLHVKYPLFLSDLNKTQVFSTDFRKKFKY